MLRRKEGNVTFCSEIYGVGHTVKDEIGIPLPSFHGLFFSVTKKSPFICTIQQTGWYIPQTGVGLWLEREIAQWMHRKRSLR